MRNDMVPSPARQAYLDFELVIGPGSGREYPVAVLRSPAGEAHGMMRFPFDELALEGRLDKLQIALLRSGGQRRRALSPEEQAVQDFGRVLFDALLTGEVRSRYDVSQREATGQGKGLRLKLRIQPPELAALPWEYLYDSRQAEYVCLSRNTPVVRYLELPQPILPLTVTPPLRILGMVASPHDLPLLDVAREKQRVENAIQALRANGLVELTWLEGQTSRDLQRAMRAGPWHVFHFIGHGGYDRQTEEGCIALADEEGQASRLSATQLGRLLADHRSLRMVLLNACEGARGSERDIFSSAAAILVRRGIPAVLAMQYEITDRAAIEFARTFYEALTDEMPVDEAVAEARKAISMMVANTVEWGTPVLYMRSPDGVLFNIREQEARGKKQKEAEAARLELERLKRVQAAQEEAERTAREQAEAERLERERREQESRIQAAREAERRARQDAAQREPVPKFRLPAWAFPAAGSVLVVMALAVIATLVGSAIANYAANSAATQTAIAARPIATELISAAPVETVTRVPTITPSPPSTLAAGATRIVEKDGMVMVYVPAGKFLMGSSDSDTQAQSDEKPQHEVNVDAFWIDRTEVTNAQYKKCAQANPACKASSYASDSRFNGDDQPVVGVDWNDAKAYCEWAGRQLPTEAQWEKATRGTDGRIYPWGNQVATCEYAVMDDGSGNGCGKGDAAWAVGSKPKGASPYGALDMAGNVWEWTADWYDEKYYGSSPPKNPTGPTAGQYRVLRGGSWYVSLGVRSAYRVGVSPDDRDFYVGFRCSR